MIYHNIVIGVYYMMHVVSLRVNYFSTIALWAIPIEFSIARQKFK